MEKTDIIHSNGHATVIEELPEERHTGEIHEIITKVPSWILRWGIMIFFGILLMVVTIGNFITYPDSIKGNLKLESAYTPMPVIADRMGRVIKLYVKQGANVSQGQTLADIAGFDNAIYSVTAHQSGTVGFIAIVQSGTMIKPNQPIFVIHPHNEQFFGLMEIPSANLNKIKQGQQVLVNLKNYPAYEYGQLKGTISYIADEPTPNGLFIIKVMLNIKTLKQPVLLKNWMTGDGEIITQNMSVEKRIMNSIFKELK